MDSSDSDPEIGSETTGRIPEVALVGRPNVGKSSLLNAIARRRISIVEETAGVTRDRITTLVRFHKTDERPGGLFELVDTGGIGVTDSDRLEPQIESQIGYALDASDLLVFIVDVRSGLVSHDLDIARMLKRRGANVLLVANKADTPNLEDAVVDFAPLAFGEPLAVSAKQRLGIGDLLDEIVERLPPGGDSVSEAEMKLAIVGRRNAGKSTLINCLTREDRVIVSEVPGTTRDSVDVRFELGGRSFIAIDTAGIRKKKSVKDSIEFYGQRRSERAIRRAEVCVLLLDATQEISQVDKKISAMIRDSFKPCIIGLNKFDLAGPREVREFESFVRQELSGLAFAPISALSALTGRNVRRTVDLALDLVEQSMIRVGTGELNDALREAVERQQPPRRMGRTPKIYYATQVAIQPPSIVLFVSEPTFFTKAYFRYLENWFRNRFEFGEIPLRIMVRKSGGRELEEEV